MTEDLRRYFEQYGAIVEAIVKTDQKTGGSRGFGFVIFETVESCELALANSDHVIDNKHIDIKPAVPKYKMEQAGGRGGGGGGSGGGGGYPPHAGGAPTYSMPSMEDQAYAQAAYQQQAQHYQQQAYGGAEGYGAQAAPYGGVPAQPGFARATDPNMYSAQGYNTSGSGYTGGYAPYEADTRNSAGRAERLSARAYHPYRQGQRDFPQQY